jgi:hypothetical protein
VEESSWTFLNRAEGEIRYKAREGIYYSLSDVSILGAPMTVNLFLCRIRRLVAIIMIFGILLCSVAYSCSFEGGTGEPYDPYQISTKEHLIQIGSDLRLMTKSFVLISDIDLDPNLPGGRIFRKAVIAHTVDNDLSNQNDSLIISVGSVTVAVFQGTFNGNGHSIRNMTIDAPGGKCIGLFGYVGNDAVINNVRIENARVSGERHVGLLAGINNGTISYCGCSGSSSGNDRVGGLIGTSKGTVTCCQSKTRVTGKQIVGGLIGHAISKSSIIDCLSRGDVTGESDIGGLIGQMLRGMVIGCSTSGHVSSQTNAGGLMGGGPYGGSIVRCCSSADIKGALVGGLVGIAQYTNIMHCRAIGMLKAIKTAGTISYYKTGAGGLAGYWKAGKGIITSSCWDRESHAMGVSAVDVVIGGSAPNAKVRLILTKGVTTTQMKAECCPAACFTSHGFLEKVGKNKHGSHDKINCLRTGTRHDTHVTIPHAKAKPAYLF